jgi:hypothetical protein
MLRLLSKPGLLPQFCLAVLLLGPSLARAEGIAVQIKGGLSSFSVNAGGGAYKQDGGLGLEFRPQINIESPSLNAAVGFFYQGHLGSNIGSFPLSRIGLALYYYPFGLALSSLSLDNDITISQNRIAPFFTGQATFVTISVTDTVTVAPKTLSFNGLAAGYMLGGGIEMPLGQSFSILAEVLLEGTLAGGTSDPTGQSTSSGLSFSAMSGLLGISIHP